MPKTYPEAKVVEIITDVANIEVCGRGKWLPVLRTIGAADGKARIEVYEGENGMRVYWNSFSTGLRSRFYLHWQWRRVDDTSSK